MPIIKRAIKKMHQDAKRTVRNAKTKTILRQALKTTRIKPTPKKVAEVASLLDKAVKFRIIHKNKAARLKARLSRKSKSK